MAVNQFLNSKEALEKQLAILRKYYNEDTVNYLISLLRLEETVFKDSDFADIFGETSLFFEIAKYNICNRAKSKIFSIPEIDKSELMITGNSEQFEINYENKFEIFSFMASGDVPTITLYDVRDSEIRIEEIWQKMRNIENYYDHKSSSHSLLFTSYNASMYNKNKHEIAKLEKEIEFIRKYGRLQKRICKLVRRTLLEDWGIKFGEEYVKKLSWVDIYRKKI